ncbi:Maph67 [Matsumuraeses phaseoli granulovirus]|uniref:Maph67 n=1 Tax=Matsumuraeses phaseoli granulovirus TaxID=2760664 RepID=A0AAE7SY78_9BBAC|nr:Maph67 [Matsumuraeses phaseoli granulovirus]QOD40030.1 Maph67 [Matsumuraeses phaseoli granulovirus]
MKRASETEPDSIKIFKHDETEEDEIQLQIYTRTPYIISEEKLFDSDVKLIVHVERSGCFDVNLHLMAGDKNLFSQCKKDILKFLYKKYRYMPGRPVFQLYVRINT